MPIAYLIDPEARTVEPIEIPASDIRAIHRAIGCECFDAARVHHGDRIYVDDVGWHREALSVFAYDGYGAPLVGRAVMLGCDAWGETTGPQTPIEDVRLRVKWTNHVTTGEGFEAMREREAAS